MRSVIILGSSGSIGTQALDVIRANPRRFEVVGLAAGSNRALLEAQAAEFGVEYTAIGIDEAVQLVRDVDADVVLNGITGSVGLAPTLAVLERGTTLALANKESLIVGGDLVTRLAAPGQIVPVDSEHSAIAQALRSGTDDEVRRLVLTASGGPFRGRTREELAEVTPAEALAHPTWDMGLVVTTNSATLVNKGLEVIEAHLLFDVEYDRIDVVVHPQSIVHSMVEFIDGSTIAQASPPDMRLPISLGLDWPDRVGGVGRPLDWTHGDELDVRAARRRRRSPPSRSPSRWAGPAASIPRCSTPRTRRRWRRSTRAASGSSTSSTPCAPSSSARGSRSATLTVASLAEAERGGPARRRTRASRRISG